MADQTKIEENTWLNNLNEIIENAKWETKNLFSNILSTIGGYVDKLKKDLEDEKEKSTKREKIILDMYNNWFKENLFFQQDMILRFQDYAKVVGISEDQILEILHSLHSQVRLDQVSDNQYDVYFVIDDENGIYATKIWKFMKIENERKAEAISHQKLLEELKSGIQSQLQSMLENLMKLHTTNIISIPDIKTITKKIPETTTQAAVIMLNSKIKEKQTV